MATPVKPPNPEQIREGVGWLTVWWGAVCAFAGALVGVVAKLTKGVWAAAKYNGRLEDVEQALVSINEWKDTYALTRAPN